MSSFDNNTAEILSQSNVFLFLSTCPQPICFALCSGPFPCYVSLTVTLGLRPTRTELFLPRDQTSTRRRGLRGCCRLASWSASIHFILDPSSRVFGTKRHSHLICFRFAGMCKVNNSTLDKFDSTPLFTVSKIEKFCSFKVSVWFRIKSVNVRKDSLQKMVEHDDIILQHDVIMCHQWAGSGIQSWYNYIMTGYQILLIVKLKLSTPPKGQIF